jgi:RNA polymerase sigma factor (sigma-70 family)
VLNRLFGAEPESSQVIAVMHHVDGMTHEEVAAEVGLSVSGVRKRLRKLRRRLHELDSVAPTPRGAP